MDTGFHLDSLFSLNATAREEWLMRYHGRSYCCTRLCAIAVLAPACVPSCAALQMVQNWMVHAGLLRMASVGGWPWDAGTVFLYALCSGAAFLLGRLAYGLWTFRMWAWWLAMSGSLLSGIGSLFLLSDSRLWLWVLLPCCAIYALLLASCAIFAELLGPDA